MWTGNRLLVVSLGSCHLIYSLVASPWIAGTRENSQVRDVPFKNTSSNGRGRKRRRRLVMVTRTRTRMTLSWTLWCGNEKGVDQLVFFSGTQAHAQRPPFSRGDMSESQPTGGMFRGGRNRNPEGAPGPRVHQPHTIRHTANRLEGPFKFRVSTVHVNRKSVRALRCVYSKRIGKKKKKKEKQRDTTPRLSLIKVWRGVKRIFTQHQAWSLLLCNYNN